MVPSSGQQWQHDHDDARRRGVATTTMTTMHIMKAKMTLARNLGVTKIALLRSACIAQGALALGERTEAVVEARELAGMKLEERRLLEVNSAGRLNGQGDKVARGGLRGSRCSVAEAIARWSAPA